MTCLLKWLICSSLFIHFFSLFFLEVFILPLQILFYKYNLFSFSIDSLFGFTSLDREWLKLYTRRIYICSENNKISERWLYACFSFPKKVHSIHMRLVPEAALSMYFRFYVSKLNKIISCGILKQVIRIGGFAKRLGTFLVLVRSNWD